MAQLRKFQFLRNTTITSFGSYADARSAAVAAFAGITTLQDGEIVLYSYKLNGDATTVHTLLGIKRTNGIEILGNYDELTAEYQSYVASEIAALIAGLESEVENETGDIKVKVKQVNGELTAVTVTDTLKSVAHSGAAADVTIADEGNLYTLDNVEDALAEVMAKVNDVDAAAISVQGSKAIKVTDGTVDATVKTVSLEIANDDLVLSQTDAGLKTTLTVDTKKYPSEPDVEGYVTDKAGKTYIQIKGIGGEVISETDAAAFVKDGFLQSVELIEATEGQENVLRFTWNSDAGSQVTDIEVSALCDVYTADETYLHLNGFEFEHKTITGLDSTDPHGITADVTVNSTTEQTFNVPTLKVDAAGHVTSVDEKTVTIALPKSIDTAVQTVTSTEAVNATDKFVAVHATRAEGSNDVVLTSEVKTQAVKDATADQNGLATAADVKQFVLDNSASVIATEKETTVAKSTTQPYTYTVGLADVTQTNNNTATSSFADANNKFTFVKAVNVDGKGRVTGVVTETVTEDFDMGTY